MNKSTETLPQLVARLRKLLANATPGPWVVWSEESADGKKFSVCHYEGSFDNDGNHVCVAMTYQGPDDAELIVEAVNALPTLLDAVSAQRARMRLSKGGRCGESCRTAPDPGCEHSSPDICVSWDYPMITVDGVERQIAGWCRECGALRVFASDDLDEERWLLPRKGASRG